MALKVVAAIQARLNSQRLPRKALAPISGQPLLKHVVDRVQAVAGLADVVLSTSDEPLDDELAALAATWGIGVSRGPVDDLIGRMHRVARETQADVLIRLWGDCPCVDPEIIQVGLDALLHAPADYIKIHSQIGQAMRPEERHGTYPYGLNFQIYRRGLLDAIQAVEDPFLREFPQEYVFQNENEWDIGILKSDGDYSDISLSVDYPQDLCLMTGIFDALYRPEEVFGYREIAAFVRRYRHRFEDNTQLPRNTEYFTEKTARPV